MMPSIFGENLFDDFFGRDFNLFPVLAGHDPLYGKHAKNLMKTDVRETDNSYELDIDLPGFKKDEVSVDLNIRQERYAGTCSRSFYVGEGVEPKDVSARFEDGILKLSLPRREQKQLPESTSIAIE